MDQDFLKDIKEGKHIDNKEAWEEAKKLSAKFPINPYLSELKEYFETWSNVVEYKLLNLERMSYTYLLILKMSDGKHFAAEVQDDGECVCSIFEDVIWKEVEYKEVLKKEWVYV